MRCHRSLFHSDSTLLCSLWRNSRLIVTWYIEHNPNILCPRNLSKCSSFSSVANHVWLTFSGKQATPNYFPQSRVFGTFSVDSPPLFELFWRCFHPPSPLGYLPSHPYSSVLKQIPLSHVLGLIRKYRATIGFLRLLCFTENASALASKTCKANQIFGLFISNISLL